MTGVFFLCVALASPTVQAAEPAQPLRLNLPEAVELALSNHPDIVQSVLILQRAQLNFDSARSQFLPSLDAGANARETYRFNPSPAVSATEESADLQLAASLNLFNGFADRANLEEQKQRLAAADGELQRQRQTLTMMVARRYTNLLTATELLDVARQDLKSQQDQLQQVTAFQLAGTRTLTDLYQQQASTAQAEFALANARSQWQIAQLELLQALNLPPETSVSVQPADAAALLARYDTPGAQPFWQRAWALRPDIKAAQRNLEAARQQIRRAAAGRLPRLDLSASAGSSYRHGSGNGSFGDQLDDNRVAGLGLAMNVPIFDRYQTRDNLARARIEEALQQATLEKLRQQVVLETGQARAELQRARQQLVAASRQLAAAQQALDAGSARYRVGASTWVELSSARTALVQAQGDEVRARFDLLFRVLNLGYACGDLAGWLHLLEDDKASG
jgi:outer membrane protein